MKKILITFVFTFLILSIASCAGETTEVDLEVNMVPHYIYAQAFDNTAYVDLALISNKEITDLTLKGYYVPTGRPSYLKEVKLHDYYKLIEYKDYYVYIVNIEFVEIYGNTEVNDLVFTINDETVQIIPNVMVTTDMEKDVHFDSTIDSPDIEFPMYKSEGIQANIQTDYALTITDIKFRVIFDFDMNQYISNIKINNTNLVDPLYINEGENISLGISFDESAPDNVYILNSLLIKYNDETEIDQSASVLVPIQLNSYEIVARNIIDNY